MSNEGKGHLWLNCRFRKFRYQRKNYLYKIVGKDEADLTKKIDIFSIPNW